MPRKYTFRRRTSQKFGGSKTKSRKTSMARTSPQVDETCSICLESMNNPERPEYKLKCRGKHKFHKECITLWCNNNNNCPNCRSIIQDDYNKLNGKPGIIMPQHRIDDILRHERQSEVVTFPDMEDWERNESEDKRRETILYLRFARGTSDWSRMTSLLVAYHASLNFIENQQTEATM
jgi:hypothetical protein